MLLVDAKGVQENEDRFAAMAAACGRLERLKVFTLSRLRRTHTYNPLHLVPEATAETAA